MAETRADDRGPGVPLFLATYFPFVRETVELARAHRRLPSAKQWRRIEFPHVGALLFRQRPRCEMVRAMLSCYLGTPDHQEEHRESRLRECRLRMGRGGAAR